MTKINLLPWREIRRRERDRQILTGSALSWMLMGLVVLYGWWHMNGLIDFQSGRNDFLEQETVKLDKQIEEIREIKRRKEALLARMEVIQQLQANRTQIVHVFDDLVRKLPKGVYLTSLNKKGKNITLAGYAQSNARVSSLMRNLDSSDWFANPDLNVINVTPNGEARVSKFTLQVKEEKKKKQVSLDEKADTEKAS
jgi:type IV pilus assembly protein PilN